jgi:hypothetical protein
LRLKGEEDHIDILSEPDEHYGDANHEKRGNQVKTFPSAPDTSIQEPEDGSSNPPED